MAEAAEAGTRKVPKAVIKRLSLYSRVLQMLERNKVEKVSSTELADQLGLNSAQVRKDLAYFGQFGVPGFGYPVEELRRRLKHILGTDREIRVALIGVGNLGTALLSYEGFGRQGFRILCAFDVEIRSRVVGPHEVPVFQIAELEERLREFQIDFAILTVPAEAAQAVTRRLV
ncbi:redox-sensing transcriptional repressor Rex, partial [Candidatus Poribacteria bacterium]|nr:redox-sensing transcriptional repressor Rex [Candidatus Poribacteria bacterium]